MATATQKANQTAGFTGVGLVVSAKATLGNRSTVKVAHVMYAQLLLSSFSDRLPKAPPSPTACFPESIRRPCALPGSRYCILIQYAPPPPEPDGFSVSGWRCPLCNATTYSQIKVTRPNGANYVTEFHECDGCTVMFRHPAHFTRLGMPVRRWAMDVEPRTLRDVHGLALDPTSMKE